MGVGVRAEAIDAERRLERWALRQAIRAGRRPWTATLVIALVLLLQTGAILGIEDLVKLASTRALAWGCWLAWIGGVGGAATLSSAMLSRGATTTRAACAWVAFTVAFPACAFGPVLLMEGPIEPLNTLRGIAIHLTLVAPVLLPAAVVLAFRALATRPARVRDAGLLLALIVAAIVGARVALERSIGVPGVLHLSLWTVLAAAVVCWWMRARRRATLHLLGAAAIAQGVYGVAGLEWARQDWIPIAGVLVAVVGALPFAVVARAADSLTVVPLDHPLHDWRPS